MLLGPRSSERGTANLGGHGLGFVGQQVLAQALEQLDRVHQLHVSKAQQFFSSPIIFSPPVREPSLLRA